METPAPFHEYSFNWTSEDYYYTEDSLLVLWKSFEQTYRSVQLACIICYSLTFVVGVTGNSLVIWIAGYRMKSVSAVWFHNLAVTDLLCNLALVIRVTEWAMDELFISKGVCLLAQCLLFFNMLTSIFFLTAISVDRCVSVLWPLWSKVHRTPRLAKIISAALWLGSLVISTTLRATHFYDSYEADCIPRYLQLVIAYERKRINSMFVFRLVFMFAVPYIIILVCNGLIVYQLKRRIGTFGSRKSSSLRPFKVIAVVVVCFFVCWFPYITWPFVPLRGKHWKVDMLMTEISVCLAYTNSCVNPIIYVFFCQEFKDNFFNFKSLMEKLETVMSEKVDLNAGEVDDANAESCLTRGNHGGAETFPETIKTTQGV